jgi:hypothetical protein
MRLCATGRLSRVGALRLLLRSVVGWGSVLQSGVSRFSAQRLLVENVVG